MLLSISSLWQQEGALPPPPPPASGNVRGGLLLALSSLLETGTIIIIEPPVPVPVGGGGFAQSKWGRQQQPGRDHRDRRHVDDEEIVEIMAMIARFL